MTSTFYVRCSAAYPSDSLGRRTFNSPSFTSQTVTHVPSLGVTHVVSCSPDGGADLERVPGAAAGQPHIVHLRMEIEDALPVDRVLGHT